MKLLLFLLLIPCASALNCSGVDPGYFEDCEYIIYSGLSEDEQIYLIQCLFDLPQDFNLISEVKPKPLPDFIVKTNKQSYSSGELVVIEVKPENRNYVLEYANQEYFTVNEFPAKYPYNRIKISFGDKLIYKHIHVKNSSLHLMWMLFLFVLINYVVVQLIRK